MTRRLNHLLQQMVTKLFELLFKCCIMYSEHQRLLHSMMRDYESLNQNSWKYKFPLSYEVNQVLV